MIEFRMPSLGADMEDGTLCEWLVKPGDVVKRGDIIAVVETQKGLIEIEVFNEGKIDQLLIKENQKVPVGTVMALITGEEKGAKKATSPPIQEKNQPEIKTKPQEKSISSVTSSRIKASPLARKIAEENKVDLSLIKGTGENNVITRQDVEEAIARMKEKAPKKMSTPGESIRMAVAAAMSRSNREIPHYYLETRIDMSKALKWLAEKNTGIPASKRILPAALFIKAVAVALKEVPQLNAIWENGMLLKEEINIGFVVSLRTGGILVPAIHDAGNKNPGEIMEALADIIVRSREMKLRSSELSDSTITVTNLGDNGVETVFGIIYPPQVALVGFGSITEQPWVENGMLGIRPVLNVTLSADHRATDGITGSRFLSALRKLLQQPELL
jgi:pyruvate dehydrogenase E2 component (dihydrolipoamide acetyltransferase)